MLVRIYEDRLGSVVAIPVSERIADRFRRDAIENGAPADWGPELFLQQPDIDEVIETLGRRATCFDRYTRERVVNGGATIRVDEREFRHMLGYCSKGRG